MESIFRKYSREEVERMLEHDRNHLKYLRKLENDAERNIERCYHKASASASKERLIDLKLSILRSEECVRDLEELLESDKQFFTAYDVF